MKIKKSIINGLSHIGDLPCEISAFGENTLTLETELPNGNFVEISIISDGLFWRGMKVKHLLEMENTTYIDYKIFQKKEGTERINILFNTKQSKYE